MLWALMLIAANDPFAKARGDIDVYCRGRPAGCVIEQRKQMAHFATMMAGFNDQENRNARRCMTKGKRGRFIDWTVAATCMRQAVKGRMVGQ